MQKSKVNSKIDFDPKSFEAKWQKKWESDKLFSPDLKNSNKPYLDRRAQKGFKEPFYNLMMFPYPSAEGLHVGNMYAFVGADVYARFNRMQGKDVFEPIGLDGFGIHSENYALKIGKNPKEQAKISEQRFYKQLRSIGNSFDWSRTLETYDPVYYRWTQWLFVKLFKAGLAYRKKAEVNWCPSDKTVLSDEQVIDGKCERCNSTVEKRDLEQWFFRITKYADRLLNNIENLDWTEKVKIAQRNWIGRSEDTEIDFPIKGSDLKIKVITTRADTLFGATFLVLAPEHELVEQFKSRISNWPEVEEYIKTSRAKTDFERGRIKDKTGVKLEGVIGVNPVNTEEIPVHIADYVLSTYGTGAIMAVPAHDDRDFDFAKKYDLAIRQVIEAPTQPDTLRVHVDDQDRSDLAQELRSLGKPMEYWTPTLRRYDVEISEAGKVTDILSKAGVGSEEQLEKIRAGRSFALEIDPLSIDFGTVYAGDGKHINSEFLNGLKNAEAIEEMVEWLSQRGLGKKSVHYHLRDWLISRQRYWGPPIPMIYCSNCFDKGKGEQKDMPGWHPVPEAELPVLLPDVEDWKPMGTGKAPLANHPEFYNVACPECGKAARRETDVSDTFLDSAWYFLGYISDIITGDKKNQKSVSRDIEVDQKLEIRNSKLEIPWDPKVARQWLPVAKYIGGAEHSVLHLLYSRFISMALADLKLVDFEEPFISFFAHGLIIKDGAKMSKSKGNVVVPDEYITKYGADTLRAYLMFLGPFSDGGDFRDSGIEGMGRFLKRIWVLFQKSISNELSNESMFQMHKTVKKVTEDISAFKYNTAISALMEYYNFLSKTNPPAGGPISKIEAETFLKLLAPFAPFITEELWQVLGFRSQVSGSRSIHLEKWPEFDPKFLVSDDVTVVVQVNGKKRSQFTVYSSRLENQENIQAEAKLLIEKYLEGQKIKKIIHVPGKIINFVV